MFRLNPTKEKQLQEHAMVALKVSPTLEQIVDYITKVKGLDKRDAVIVTMMALSISYAKQVDKKEDKLNKKKNGKGTKGK